MLIEIDLTTIMAAVGVDILIGATALIVAVRNNKLMTTRMDRVESHLQLPPIQAAEGK